MVMSIDVRSEPPDFTRWLDLDIIASEVGTALRSAGERRPGNFNLTLDMATLM
jgi:hypothetical protein